MKALLNWQSNPGSRIQAPLSYAKDYVISHRPDLFCLSYRPTGKHVSLGQFKTLEAAKQAAQDHFNSLS